MATFSNFPTKLCKYHVALAMCHCLVFILLFPVSIVFGVFSSDNAQNIINAYGKYLTEVGSYAISAAYLHQPERAHFEVALQNYKELLQANGLDQNLFPPLSEDSFKKIYVKNPYEYDYRDQSRLIEEVKNIAQQNIETLKTTIGFFCEDPSGLFIPKIGIKYHYYPSLEPKKFSLDAAFGSSLFDYVDSDNKGHILKASDFINIEPTQTSGKLSLTYSAIRRSDYTVWFIKTENSSNNFCDVYTEVIGSKLYRSVSDRVLPLGLVTMKLPSIGHKDGAIVVVQPFLENIRESAIRDSTPLKVLTWDKYASDEEKGIALSHQILDLWIGNRDSHRRNCLITYDGRFVPIDFGNSFRLYFESKSMKLCDIMEGYPIYGKYILGASRDCTLTIPSSAFLYMRNIILKIQAVDIQTITDIVLSIPEHCARGLINWSNILEKMLIVRETLLEDWEELIRSYHPDFAWPVDQAESICLNRCNHFSWAPPLCVSAADGKIFGSWFLQTRTRRDLSRVSWKSKLSKIDKNYITLDDHHTFDSTLDCWLYFEGLSADIALHM